jgi:hypothetical protein
MAAAVHPPASLHANTAMNTSNSISDDQIDNEQLGEYREMIEELGTFPVRNRFFTEFLFV